MHDALGRFVNHAVAIDSSCEPRAGRSTSRASTRGVGSGGDFSVELHLGGIAAVLHGQLGDHAVATGGSVAGGVVHPDLEPSARPGLTRVVVELRRLGGAVRAFDVDERPDVLLRNVL